MGNQSECCSKRGDEKLDLQHEFFKPAKTVKLGKSMISSVYWPYKGHVLRAI